MTLRLTEGAAEAFHYDKNTAWELIDFQANNESISFGGSDAVYDRLVFHLEIRRYPTIHFFYMLIPILLIQVLALMQFLLPCDAIEKVRPQANNNLGTSPFERWVSNERLVSNERWVKSDCFPHKSSKK